MPINQPILAVNTSSRASVRTTALPVVPTIPPSPYYVLTEDVVVTQMIRNPTVNPGVLSGGTYTENVIASPVDGALTGDQWTGSSTIRVLMRITNYEPKFYTFSVYARGVSPTPTVSFDLYMLEGDYFGGGSLYVAQKTVNVTTGVWQRISLTGYVGRPELPHYILLGNGTFTAGESVYLANWQIEPGTNANAWISSGGVGDSTAIQDAYTEFTQQPEREGQMVAFVQSNSAAVETATLYVVVNISGTLTWKPVVGISKTIDPRTGLPYDSNLNFYSSLGG